jgi:putative two-component system response regulator
MASEYRDDDTGVHNERMSRYAEVVGRALGLSPADLFNLRRAAMLHDVGKIAIPDAILLKPGKLTDDEFDQMKLHTVYGGKILGGSHDPVLALAAEIAMTHHERVDGTGYPNGLAGDRIPQAGRIAAIADVFDALTSDRVYRPAFKIDEAIEVVTAGRGTQFDADVFDAFERSLDEILAIRDQLNSQEGPDPSSASGSKGPAPHLSARLNR